MQEPDEEPEQPDDFVELFVQALEKVPPEDYDRVGKEALKEMRAEAMMGVPTPLWFPPKVLERIYAYEKEHAIDRNKLIPAAVKSTKGRTAEVVEMMNRYLKDPDGFEWPAPDPLLCICLALMRASVNWLTKKINQEYRDVDGDEDQADWWKEEE